VQAIAHQTLRNSSSVDDFIEHFGGRLLALDTAHSLLVQSHWQGADLAVLAQKQLEPYISDYPDRLHIEGETVLLPADLATPFGIVLHELATNAAKYGSLSEANGIVSLSWKVTKGNGGSALTVMWKEKAGPPVKPPAQAGFGNTLIEKGIPGASVKREYRQDGLVCTIDLPLPGLEHGATSSLKNDGLSQRP
jgi:two-component system CheB/CheR fusion protein